MTNVSNLLREVYGDIEWVPRYNGTEELIFTILSQNTSDINSERAFKSLFTKFTSLEQIAESDVTTIENAIKNGGLAKTKAPRIKSVLNVIKTRVGSYDLSFLPEMPLDEAKKWLTSLNGIGPKTAAIILCFSFGMPAMPVDTHVFRVAKRLGLIGNKITVEAAHPLLEEIIEPENIFEFHMYLIKHGRDTCKAIRPRCETCLLKNPCKFYDSLNNNKEV